MSLSSSSSISFHAESIVQGLNYLSQNVREWCQGTAHWKPGESEKESLLKLASDLDRQSQAWMADRPFLIIVLMGGTGVGKSTLLNALAGSRIAPSDVARPTTVEPIVYLHERLDLMRLAPELRACRTILHNRSELEHKVLVDTPDLDSNATEHRDRLEKVLPLADVVLYVGSQEKYHDEAGWTIFREQRNRRAFAFVLNKWDRCAAPSATGMRPDEDLKRDLEAEGFADPLIFRTVAYQWVDAHGIPADLPPDEQFPQLARWLQQGLTKQEITSIHAKGIVRTLNETVNTLRSAMPPDISKTRSGLEEKWKECLAKESLTMSQALIGSVDPDQRKLEAAWSLHHSFPLRGFFGYAVRFIDTITHLGSGKPWQAIQSQRDSTKPEQHDFADESKGWAVTAWNQHIETHLKSIPDRLHSAASEAGWPRSVLTDGIQSAIHRIQSQEFASRLQEAIRDVGSSFTNVQSWRNRLGRFWGWIGNGLPTMVVLFSFVWLLRGYIFADRPFFLSDLLLPFILGFVSLLLLYWIYRRLMRVKWSKLRGDCIDHVSRSVTKLMDDSFQPVLHAAEAEITPFRETCLTMIHSIESSAKFMAEQERSEKVAVLFSQGS